MDFSFTEEQNALRKVIKDFTKKELLPKYAYWDRRSEFFSGDLWRSLAELGLTGIHVPAQYGGLDADFITTGIALEEIAKGDFSCAVALTVCWLTTDIIRRGGSEKAKSEWLTSLAEGKKKLAIAVTEPHCGTDAAAMRCRAERKGDTYILNGEKSGTTMITVADAALLFAKTNPQAGAKGVSAFLVPTNLPGITRQSYSDMGGKSILRGSIFLDNVEIPSENLVGTEGGAFKEMMVGFDGNRIFLALMCVGAADITLEETIRYTKERHAFNMPLAKFEGVSFPVAEYYSMIEAVRWLCYKALWMRDQGLPTAEISAMVKLLGPKIAVDAIHKCLLLHGHYGYTQEFPIEQRLRDVIGVEIADGTEEASKIVLTRELFGREYLPY